MRLMCRILATGMILAVVTIGAHAQGICGASMLSGPIQYVSDDEFNQMVGAGTLVPVTPELCAQAELGGLFEYLQDEAYVWDYLRQNPELTDLAALSSPDEIQTIPMSGATRMEPTT